MSSSPTDCQGSDLYSLQSPSRNFIFGHGSPGGDRGSQSIGSAQITPSEVAAVPDVPEFGKFFVNFRDFISIFV